MNVCVVGHDSVAVGIATQIAAHVGSVTICGLRADEIEAVAAGRCPFPEEPGLTNRFEDVVAGGRLVASDEITDAAASAHLVVLVEAVELDRQLAPDYTRLEQVTEQVARGLSQNNLVLFDGMLAVGDTRNRLGPLLEAGSGLRMGEEFGLAFSPERARSGHLFLDLQTSPKIVGGIDEQSSSRAVAVLQTALDTIVVGATSLETAEFVRLAETAARDVNAALAVELAACADRHGVRMREALFLINTQPGFPVRGADLAADGTEVGMGATLLAAEGQPELVKLGRRINDNAVSYVVFCLERCLDSLKESRISLVVDEAEESLLPPASFVARLLAALRAAGARPHLEELSSATGTHPDQALVVLSGGASFESLRLDRRSDCRVVLDGASCLSRRRVEAAGMRYIGVGL